MEALKASLKCAFQGRGIGGSFLLVGTFSGLTEFSKNAIVPKLFGGLCVVPGPGVLVQTWPRQWSSGV